MNPLGVLLATFAFLTATVCAQDARREWTVDGVTREALVFAPHSAKVTPAPIVFAFHGHGGTMLQAALSFHYHKLWPEAVVVYMQGLNTVGRLTDPEGKKSGWQSAPRDQGDRDLKFLDTVLASLRADFKVDDRRIYATGHSNGGAFTYVLWAARRDVFAAFAPSSSPAVRNLPLLRPAPAILIAGENDALVKFAWQQPTMTALRKLNNTGEGKPWHDVQYATHYPSAQGNDVVTYIHPGTHKFPAEAPAAIVRFFKEHTRGNAANPREASRSPAGTPRVD